MNITVKIERLRTPAFIGIIISIILLFVKSKILFYDIFYKNLKYFFTKCQIYLTFYFGCATILSNIFDME